MNESGTTVNSSTVDAKNFFYPPGGILLWIIIILELLTFGIALVVMAFTSHEEQQLFHETASKLNATFGTINTFVLLSSGYFIALSVQQFKAEQYKKSNQNLLFGIAGGVVFIIIKSLEYSFKIQEGLTLGYNTFMDFYWLLTGFHLIHVIVGIVILLWIRKFQPAKPHDKALLDFESGAAFWHLCDLIWLLLFPVLYLLF